MKKILICAVFILFFLCNATYAENADYNKLNISTESCILIDADTGNVIYEKNPDKVLYPASITKTMTAVLAIEKGNFNKPFTVSENAICKVGSGASVAGLVPQEKVYLSDLLYILLLPSGNDAANVIAENVAGSIDNFVGLMNKKAQQLGAVNTTFANPIGLDSGDGYYDHKTTARDFALITRYAMSLRKYRQVVSTMEYELPITNKHKNRTKIENTNCFFTSINYDKNLYLVNGGKTGWTMAASNTLTVSAKNSDNIELVCVLLKNPDRLQIFSDAKKLLDYGFTLIGNNQIDITSNFYDVRFRGSKDVIKSFSESGYIKGYDDNSFRPLKKISKEEFITLFLRINNEKCKTSEDYWSKPYLDVGVKRNLIDTAWYNDRRKSIKRKEVMNVLCKFIEQNFGMQYLSELHNTNIISSDFIRQVINFYNGNMMSVQKDSLEKEISREEMVILLNEYIKLKDEADYSYFSQEFLTAVEQES